MRFSSTQTSRHAFLVSNLSLNISRVLLHKTGLVITRVIKTSLSISSVILKDDQAELTTDNLTGYHPIWRWTSGKKSCSLKGYTKSHAPLSSRSGPAPEHSSDNLRQQSGAGHDLCRSRPM